LSFGRFFHGLGTVARLRLSLLLLLLVGLLFSMMPWTTFVFVKPFFGSDILAKILEEIGKAFVIAAVLAIVVEGAQKLKLLNEFSENISLHIMGRNLPSELRAHLEQYLGATFVRRKMFVTYKLKAWDDKPDRVKLTKLIRYELENCSDDEAEYHWQYRVDDSWFSDAPKATVNRMGLSNPDTGNRFKEYSGEELKKKIEPEPGGQRFHQSVRIRGRALYAPNPTPSYQFIAESTECFPSGYSEHLTATYPVLTTELTVEYDKEVFAVSVYLPLAGPHAFQDPNGTETIDGKFWVIQQPILPGQSFFTTWRKLTLPAALGSDVRPPAQPPTPNSGVTQP
jgi:hypothetical protein